MQGPYDVLKPVKGFKPLSMNNVKNRHKSNEITFFIKPPTKRW